MNDIPTSSGITRRSFIKRSVVAAVAVSSMTIFSGLVNANLANPYRPFCPVKKDPGTFGDGGQFQNVNVLFCQAEIPCCETINCGKFYKLDKNRRVMVDPQTGKPLTERVTWNCSDMEANPWYDPEVFPNEPKTRLVQKMCFP